MTALNINGTTHAVGACRCHCQAFFGHRASSKSFGMIGLVNGRNHCANERSMPAVVK